MVFIIATFSCNQNIIGGSEYAILPYQDYLSIKNATPAKLSHAEVLNIEEIIKKEVSKIINSHNKELDEYYQKYNTDRDEDLYKYASQYVAYYNSKGEKIVWIDFFCNPEEFENWRIELKPDVEDGGNCFFNLKVNTETNEIFDFYINGVAELIKPKTINKTITFYL